MTVRISRALYADLLARAAASPDAEVCGLLLGAPNRADLASENPVRPKPVEGRAAGGGARCTSFDFAQDEREGCGEFRITALAPAANVAPDPATRFEIDPAALFAALRAERAGGARLLGHYHSHPRGPASPSACDAALAHDAGRLWLILGEGVLTAWRAVPGGPIHGAFAPVRLEIAADGCETGHLSPKGPPTGLRDTKDRG